MARLGRSQPALAHIQRRFRIVGILHLQTFDEVIIITDTFLSKLLLRITKNPTIANAIHLGTRLFKREVRTRKTQ